MLRRAILIAGPTASGKSSLALRLAERDGGVIINTDSMQVYRVLQKLSARPGEGEMARAQHYLYGFVDPNVRFSAGAWLRAATDLVNSGQVANKTLIFTGGTGLYFQGLTDGFTAVPDVPEEIVKQVSEQVLGLSRHERAALLFERDRETAQQLKEPDQQRVIRALSVLLATGRSLSSWQKEKKSGVLAGFELKKLVLSPDRAELDQRIKRRFSLMLEEGAIDEVSALMAQNIGPDLPVMKAIGVRQIADWQAGIISREEVLTSSVTATRQYAKRQRTWFRKKMKNWEWIA
ncbi:tRNA dimethylallyltransferase [hydrothermal vent metagenome]|uniref:tRNA dimethylallyltransferase n=1 Tax=hydrothermal vent metagenome TaxID=652676 RepID=A0A3B0UAF7_9ZZZZ